MIPLSLVDVLAEDDVATAEEEVVSEPGGTMMVSVACDDDVTAALEATLVLEAVVARGGNGEI